MEIETKVRDAMHRIEELYNETGGECYVSFSGGKDSTILLALIKMCEEIYTIPIGGIPAVFVNTGVELGATIDFVKWCKDSGWYGNLKTIRPEKSFHWCLTEKGKPMKSKLKSEMLARYQKNQKEGVKNTACYYLHGVAPNGKSYQKTKIANKDLHLLHGDFDIKVSNKCCDVLKKKPAGAYVKANLVKGYMLGERMAEGGVRQMVNEKRVQNGGKPCTKYSKGVIVKLPIIDWTDEDCDAFISKYNVPLSNAYTKYGLKRTGCIGCPYALDLTNNLKVLYDYEPIRYKATMHWLKDVYIAQNVSLPFDEQYEKERIDKWNNAYSDMRYEMMQQHRSELSHKWKDKDKSYNNIVKEDK